LRELPKVEERDVGSCERVISTTRVLMGKGGPVMVCVFVVIRNVWVGSALRLIVVVRIRRNPR
jgi:hypothetical protein